MSEILFVEYCAKDFIDGTYNMDAITELAYRRICDLIYTTNDNLLDNDTLQFSTKTGSKWKKIRKELIETHQKIFIEDGYVRVRKCTEKLAKSRKNIEQKRDAGKASFEKRKSLKNNNTGSTAVETTVPTARPTNQKPKDPIKKIYKKDSVSEGKDFDDFWKEYPKKVGQGAARSAWSWAIQTGASPEQMVNSARNYYNQRLGEDEKFTLAPKTFIHEKHYLNEDLQAKPHVPMDATGLEDWQKKVLDTVGEQRFKGWFEGAKLENKTLYVQNQNTSNFIKQNFLTPCRGIFYEVEVVQ